MTRKFYTPILCALPHPFSRESSTPTSCAFPHLIFRTQQTRNCVFPKELRCRLNQFRYKVRKKNKNCAKRARSGVGEMRTAARDEPTHPLAQVVPTRSTPFAPLLPLLVRGELLSPVGRCAQNDPVFRTLRNPPGVFPTEFTLRVNRSDTKRIKKTKIARSAIGAGSRGAGGREKRLIVKGTVKEADANEC
jgi:hypothetical protein